TGARHRTGAPRRGCRCADPRCQPMAEPVLLGAVVGIRSRGCRLLAVDDALDRQEGTAERTNSGWSARTFATTFRSAMNDIRGMVPASTTGTVHHQVHCSWIAR